MTESVEASAKQDRATSVVPMGVMSRGPRLSRMRPMNGPPSALPELPMKVAVARSVLLQPCSAMRAATKTLATSTEPTTREVLAAAPTPTTTQP